MLQFSSQRPVPNVSKPPKCWVLGRGGRGSEEMRDAKLRETRANGGFEGWRGGWLGGWVGGSFRHLGVQWVPSGSAGPRQVPKRPIFATSAPLSRVSEPPKRMVSGSWEICEIETIELNPRKMADLLGVLPPLGSSAAPAKCPEVHRRSVSPSFLSSSPIFWQAPKTKRF